MTYQEVINYLFTQVPMFHREGAAAYKPGLEVITALCEAIGNPQRQYPCIHVAGTNGKGSTSSLLSSVLQCAGKKVGLFTSPHIHDFRERMKVNAQTPSEEWIIAFFETNKMHLERLQPTFFEITTAMAFAFFAEAKVDFAVIEVGMGGRLDATNLIVPIMSVITNIGLDHTEFLGTTLEAIAMEKAGIIKRKIPVVAGEVSDELAILFKEKAKALQSPLIFSDQTLPVQHWKCALQGSYQNKNKCTAYAVTQALNAYCQLSITDPNVQQGFIEVLERTGLKGRWQQIGVSPRVICDTGHNAHGLRYVVEQLLSEKGKGQLIVVFGMVKDKDIESVLRLLPLEAHYIFTQANIPRAMPKEQLAEMAQTFGLHGELAENVPKALQKAKEIARSEDLIFIGGSTFVVSEIPI